MKCLGPAFVLLLGLFSASAQTANPARDADSDGLDDTLEQRLLERFRPQFMLSPLECDVAPAAFVSNQAVPTVSAQDGTIYGQVFRHSSQAQSSLVEIHYYHLWSRDCARLGHALDAEHVAALVGAASAAAAADEYEAIYWYSAAHEETMCDGSSGAKAAFLNAQTRGPRVWVSAGKHASFLDDKCTAACSRDRCDDAVPMVRGNLANLGEPGKPLNGATWTASKEWPLEAKMHVRFSEAYVRRLQSADGIIALNDASDGKKGVIRRADMTAEAMDVGYTHTSQAISTGVNKTGAGAEAGYSGTKSSLRRAADAVGRWFRRGKK